MKQTRGRMQSYGLRERAWWVIRRRGVFTLPELLETVANGTERDATSNIGRYLRILVRVGILSRDTKRQPGAAATSNGYLRYRLARDVGHRAPVWRASRNEVYDPNTGAVYPLGGAGDE